MRGKLQTLVKAEGYASFDDMLPDLVSDSVCPAICCNPEEPGCNYIEGMEPDQDAGWCAECGKGTLKSALILGGVI